MQNQKCGRRPQSEGWVPSCQSGVEGGTFLAANNIGSNYFADIISAGATSKLLYP